MVAFFSFQCLVSNPNLPFHLIISLLCFMPISSQFQLVDYLFPVNFSSFISSDCAFINAYFIVILLKECFIHFMKSKLTC